MMQRGDVEAYVAPLTFLPHLHIIQINFNHSKFFLSSIKYTPDSVKSSECLPCKVAYFDILLYFTDILSYFATQIVKIQILFIS